MASRLATKDDVPTETREQFRLPGPAAVVAADVFLRMARVWLYQLGDLGQFERGSWPEFVCRELPELFLNRTPSVSLAVSQSS